MHKVPDGRRFQSHVAALLVGAVVVFAACSASATTSPAPAATAATSTSAPPQTSSAPVTPNTSPQAASQTAACAYQNAVQGDTLTVGIVSDPPFIIRTVDGQWTSLAPVLDRKFATFLCKKIEFIPIGFSTAIAGLQAGKYMMIGADMHKTPERAKVAAFSTPFNTSGTTYWVDRSGPITTLAQLNNPSVSIAVITGSDNQTATEKYLPKAHEVLLPNASITDVMLQLQTQKVTAFSNSSFLVPALAQRYPQWRAIPDNTTGLIAQGQGWIFNLNETALLAAANAFMAMEIQNGDLGALTKQYVTLENALAPAR